MSEPVKVGACPTCKVEATDRDIRRHSDFPGRAACWLIRVTCPGCGAEWVGRTSEPIRPPYMYTSDWQTGT